MKKLLLTSAAVAALSTSAFAADDSAFYLRADAGFDIFNNQKVNGIKLKSKYTGDISAGVGYKVMDNARAELAYAYYFTPTRKGSTTTTAAGQELHVKTKANIQTLMLKGYYDVADLGMAKVFVGAGIGGSRISQKNFEGNFPSVKEKAKNNFSWLLGLGAGFEVTDAVTIDVQYNYQDFGKSSAKIKGVNNFDKSKYRAHAIKAGVRFDI